MSRGLAIYANARDGNESEIVALWRKMGITVTLHNEPFDTCSTFLDLSRWAEIKMPEPLRRGETESDTRAKGYTDKQLKTLAKWPNRRVDTICTIKQAVAFADQLKADARLLRAAKVAA